MIPSFKIIQIAMATLHTGRRPALIPSMDCLTPEEAQDILCNRIGRPAIPPPKACLAVSPTEDQIGLEEPGRSQMKKQPESQQIMFQLGPTGQLDYNRNYQTRKDGSGRDLAAPRCTLTHGNPNKPVRWDKPGKQYARGRISRQEANNLYGENKRKHAVYARDDQRRYSNEILEDIPHMSEIDSSHGIRSSCKDVFGMKGQKSLFVEVCISIFGGSQCTCLH